MSGHTVKERIFRTNTAALLVIVLFFVGINIGFIKIYGESVERQWKKSMEQVITTREAEEIIKNWTIRKQSFYWMLLADIGLCAGAFFLIVLHFTRNLAEHICEPLKKLEAGANRVCEQELSIPIEYHGEAEFEQVCAAFNQMEQAILEEQEKNRAYEKAKNDMIIGISHDLKTPLTAVGGTIKALVDGVVLEPEKQKYFLETAYRRTEEMNQLLNRLIHLARLEAGKISFNMQCLDLEVFLHDYCEMRGKSESREKEILLVHDYGTGHRIYADSEQLVRILDNLIENSRKYSQKTPVLVTLSLKEQHGNVTLEVHDNGNGVEDAKLPYLFDEFYRGDDSRGIIKGNGLGLYIVKRLTEQMGGKVEAQNQDGFLITIQFPAAKERG